MKALSWILHPMKTKVTYTYFRFNNTFSHRMASYSQFNSGAQDFFAKHWAKQHLHVPRGDEVLSLSHSATSPRADTAARIQSSHPIDPAVLLRPVSSLLYYSL
jgi:hypothetical protein